MIAAATREPGRPLKGTEHRVNLSVSIPVSLKEEIKARAAKAAYANVSEFVESLLRGIIQQEQEREYGAVR